MEEKYRTCLYCSTTLYHNNGNPISETSTSDIKFCNKSCSTTYNNLKRKPKQYKCDICGKPTTRRRTYCDECNPNIVNWDNKTYGEIKEIRIYQPNSRIRTLARNKYLASDKPKLCIHCGYDKHFEVCHIKGISEFSDDTKLSEINNLDNLIALCPNCHWELDYGDLTMEEILHT